MRPFSGLFSAVLVLLLLNGCSVGYQHDATGWKYVIWDEGRGRWSRPIPTEGRSSLRILADKDYAIDARHVYYQGEVLEGARPGSFFKIAKYYWRDSSGVYFSGKRIQGADPASFVVLQHYPWSKDHQHAYRYDHRMEVHDPATFVSINEFRARDSKAFYSNSIAGGGEIRGANSGNEYFIQAWDILGSGSDF